MYMYMCYCVLCLFLCTCSLLKTMVKNHFKEDFNGIFKHLSDSGNLTEDDMRSLMFGDYLVPDAVCLSNLILYFCTCTCIINY